MLECQSCPLRPGDWWERGNLLPIPNPRFRACRFQTHMSVSINGGTPKWMLFIMENFTKMDNFGGTTIYGNLQMGHSLRPARICNFPSGILLIYLEHILKNLQSLSFKFLTRFEWAQTARHLLSTQYPPTIYIQTHLYPPNIPTFFGDLLVDIGWISKNTYSGCSPAVSGSNKKTTRIIQGSPRPRCLDMSRLV